jgi:RHS repeat-associated protein
MSYDDVDAWGMVLGGRSRNSGDGRQRYKFTEKERDAETGYDDFEARLYDSRIGMFRGPDPLSSSYPGRSPYVYAGNNPVRFFDPTGMADSSTTKVEPAQVLPLALPVLRFVAPAIALSEFALGSVMALPFIFSGDQSPALKQEEAGADDTKADTAESGSATDKGQPNTGEARTESANSKAGQQTTQQNVQDKRTAQQMISEERKHQQIVSRTDEPQNKS